MSMNLNHYSRLEKGAIGMAFAALAVGAGWLGVGVIGVVLGSCRWAMGKLRR